MTNPVARAPQRKDDPPQDSGQPSAVTEPVAWRQVAEPPTRIEEEPGGEYPDADGWVPL